MSNRFAKGAGAKGRVLKAVASGCCNTSQDVSAVTGIEISQASSYLAALARQGLVRRTGREMPNFSGHGRWLQVFEVVA